MHHAMQELEQAVFASLCMHQPLHVYQEWEDLGVGLTSRIGFASGRIC